MYLVKRLAQEINSISGPVKSVCSAQTKINKRLEVVCGQAESSNSEKTSPDCKWFADQWSDLCLDLGDIMAAFDRRQLLCEKYIAKSKETSSATGEKREVKKIEKDRIYDVLQQVADILADDLHSELLRLRQALHDMLGHYAQSFGSLVAGRPSPPSPAK